MKKVLIFAVAIVASGFVFAKPNTKGNVIVGVTPVASEYNSSKDANEEKFGGTYACADVVVENDYLTAAGKLYYRVKMHDDTDSENKDLDSSESLAQEIEIKKAYVRVRPFGNKLLEASIGKLYSYYLTGNFFQLGEIYTGASRWGKTGIGVKSEVSGFTFGAAMPVTESYVEYSNDFGIAGAIEYDFSELSKSVPVTFGGTFSYAKASKADTKKKTDNITNEFSSAFSVNYAPSLKGFVKRLNVTLTANFNAEPYVSHSTFKNVSNYNNADMKLSHFASVNFRSFFGRVQFILEGEAGHSVKGSMIPLYMGTQVLVPVVNHFYFKPQFYYYAGIDEDNDDNSRQTFEFYPRLWYSNDKLIVSAGCDFDYKEKQSEKNDYVWEWKIPMYVEYKL